MIEAFKIINNFENGKKIKYSGEFLYNILMEKYDIINVNNLICETLHPENTLAKLQIVLQKLNPLEQINLVKEYNKCVVKNNIFTPKK